MIKKELKPIDNIRSLYKMVGNKVAFIMALSEVNGRAPISMQNHWFGRFWAIPIEEQQNVIAFMQNYIKQLNMKSNTDR